jgi:hypothetical protein
MVVALVSDFWLVVAAGAAALVGYVQDQELSHFIRPSSVASTLLIACFALAVSLGGSLSDITIGGAGPLGWGGRDPRCTVFSRSSPKLQREIGTRS